jgi:hypothetical protein
MVGEGIHAIDFAFVAGKWANPFWQVWDCLMLWLALIHGTNGMRTLVNDYTEREWIRRTLIWVLWIVCFTLILIGTLALTTFSPCGDQASLQVLARDGANVSPALHRQITPNVNSKTLRLHKLKKRINSDHGSTKGSHLRIRRSYRRRRRCGNARCH